jgi:hypothetical protein
MSAIGSGGQGTAGGQRPDSEQTAFPATMAPEVKNAVENPMGVTGATSSKPNEKASMLSPGSRPMEVAGE